MYIHIHKDINIRENMIKKEKISFIFGNYYGQREIAMSMCPTWKKHSVNI